MDHPGNRYLGTMRDDEIRRYLRERNPWWLAAATGGDPTVWARHDPVLMGAEATEVGYTPTLVNDVAPPMLVVVRGPRRVGKSVMVKRRILDWCSSDQVGPGRVVYASGDGMRAADLRRLFTLARELAPSDGPLYWVVDEISAIDGWASIVKELRDNTALAHDAVVLTGSSAFDLDEARKALGPGRTRTDWPFRVMLPMSFRDVARAYDVELPEVPHFQLHELQSQEAKGALQQLSPCVHLLDLAWQRYLESGGFPRAVSEHVKSAGVSAEFLHDVRSWVMDDLQLDHSPEVVMDMLDQLQRRVTSPLNVTSTSESLGLSRDVLSARMNRLTRTFAASWCHQIDEDGSRVTGSQSKLYLVDPLLSWLPFRSGESKREPSFTSLTEQQLAIACARSVDSLVRGRFVDGTAIGYRRTGSGNEVDFGALPIRVGGSWVSTTPLESKWVSKGHWGEARVINGVYKRGIIATKDVLDTTREDVWAVPAPCVALMLSDNTKLSAKLG